MLSKEEIEKLKELSRYGALKNIDREDNVFGEFVTEIQIEANKLATKIHKVQEYILEEIKEKGEISDFKQDVMDEYTTY